MRGADKCHCEEQSEAIQSCLFARAGSMAVVCSSFSAAERRARRILRLRPADCNADEVEIARILSGVGRWRCCGRAAQGGLGRPASEVIEDASRGDG